MLLALIQLIVDYNLLAEEEITYPITQDYGSSVSKLTLAPGEYKLECWGAQGSNSRLNGNYAHNGGYGAHVEGIIHIIQPMNISLIVGDSSGNPNGG